MIRYKGIFALVFALLIADFSFAQQTLQGSVERIKVHGKGLEGNLEGNSADPEVSVYLPPS